MSFILQKILDVVTEVMIDKDKSERIDYDFLNKIIIDKKEFSSIRFK